MEDASMAKNSDSEAAVPSEVPAFLKEYSHKDTLVFRLPGFAWAKTTYDKDFDDQVLAKLQEFEKSKSVADDVKSRIRERVQRSVAMIHGYEAWDPVRVRAIHATFLLAFIAPLLLGIAWLPIWGVPDRGWVSWVTLIVSAGLTLVLFVVWMAVTDDRPVVLVWGPVLAFGLAVLLGFGIPNVSWLPRIALDAFSVFASFTIMLVLFLLYIIVVPLIASIPMAVCGLVLSALGVYWLTRFDLPYVPLHLEESLEAGLIAGTSCAMAFVAITGLDKLLGRAIYEIKAHRHPEDEIVATMTAALALVEFKDWNDPSVRDEVFIQLEWIAQGVERRLRRSMPISDPTTALWLRVRTAEVGAYFRQLAQEALFPNAETRERLLDQLSEQLPDLAEGNWGDVKRVEGVPSRAPREKQWGLVRQGFSITIPFVSVGVLTLWPEILPENIRNVALITALGWGIGSVMTWLDPKADPKMTVAKFPGVLKKPKDVAG